MLIFRWAIILTIFILSYFTGFAAYTSTLWNVWGETLGGDRYAVMFWSGLAYLLILGPLFALICILVKSKLKHPALGLLFYPLFCSLSFIVPTAFIFLFNGGGSLLSAEAQLFYSFFAASGLTFGLGYGIISIIWRPKPPMQSESLEHVQ